MEYIELLYTGQTHFDLRGYWLVLYNGKNNQAYRVVNLTGYCTNEQGYFLVGSALVTPSPVIVLPPNTIQNGGDAVALYHSTTFTYSVGMAVTEAGLVDAVVYKSRASDRADKLLKVLTPGQNILYEDDSHSSQDESLSRCNSQSPRVHSSFQVGDRSCLVSTGWVLAVFQSAYQADIWLGLHRHLCLLFVPSGLEYLSFTLLFPLLTM